MKTITIRDLHQKTGQWVRRAIRYGEIAITDHGRTVANVVSEVSTPNTPYFARRKLTPQFRKLMDSGKFCGGTDSTLLISEDRERSCP